MRRFAFALAAAFAVAGPASACLNDSELPGHEREFRSSYKRQQPPAPATHTLPTEAAPVALYGTGGALLAAAGFVVFRRPTKG